MKSQTTGTKSGSFATSDVVAITNASLTLTTGVDTTLVGGAGSGVLLQGLASADMDFREREGHRSLCQSQPHQQSGGDHMRTLCLRNI